MRNYSLLTLRLCAALAIALLTCQRGLSGTPPSSERVRYDSHCFTIDGRDVFLYSGAFHYFRCPKELWRDRFQKIRDAGFNAVETYAAWNWHEPQMPAGTNDFSKADLTDLDDWLKMAEQFGFYVIVRPGPYICAEWADGGFPQWLMTKKPATPLRDQAWLRSDDPVFLAWSRHWYDAVCPVIAKHQVTRKQPGEPGVILVQLENEYDFAHLPQDVMLNQLKALAQAARDNGIDVPLFTCWTHPVRDQNDPALRGVFDTCNFYPRWNVDETLDSIEKLRHEQSSAPLMTTELQGGWFSQVGGKLSEDQDGVTASQINNLTLFVIQNGETAMSYYMLFGGSNLGDWAARDLTTSYDYNAPIREWGGVGERYQRVWAIGHMLREHGAKLARAEAVECDVNVPQKDVTVVLRRASDGSRYFFVRTSQHTDPREGTARVKEKSGDAPEIVFDYQLEPFGAKILYLPPGVNDPARGQWLPKSAPAIERPKDLPQGVAITSARAHADPGAAHWTKLRPGEKLAQAGIYDSRFVFYRAKISSKTATNLLVEFPHSDGVFASVNGKPVARAGGTATSAVFPLAAGKSDVQLLYENRGFVNGGNGMEDQAGISAARLSSSIFDGGQLIGGWHMHEVNGTSHRPEVEPDFNDEDWTPVAVDTVDADNLHEGRMAVYRAKLDVAARNLTGHKIILTFGRIDDTGWIYVNGSEVGKATDWWRAQSFDVTKVLHPGRNVIAVIVRNDAGAGGLGMPMLNEPNGNPAALAEWFGNPAGIEKQWWKPALRDRSWTAVSLPTSAEKSLLTWYRMRFELPAVKPGVWIPWHVQLNATGNGFLYLNGHAIGRYWEAGPQHKFFLPECWLNFGAGKSNVLTLDLRPGEKGAAIQSAVVEPYADFAEKR